MKSLFRIKTHPYFLTLILFSLFSYSSIKAQSEKSFLTKINELKSSPDFNTENPTYINLLNELAKEHIYVNPDSTNILLKESYELSIKSTYKKGESRALLLYGHYYSERGDKAKAFEFNSRALVIATAANLVQEQIDVLNNLGIDYWQAGDDAEALTHYLRALPMAEEIENFYMISVLNDNMALLYRDNDDFETALVFHERSRQISAKHNNEKLLARTLVNMASIHTERGDFVTAEPMIDKSIEYFKKNKLLGWLSYCYEAKGGVALKLQHFQEALDWYSKSKVLCDKIAYRVGYTQTYNGLAESYLGLNDLKSAEKYALKALKISKELNVITALKKSNFNLATVYQKKGDYQKAYKYKTRYIELYEKGAKADFKKGLGFLRSEMKFKNQKKFLIEQNNKALAKQKLYVYLAIAALILVTLFLLMVYRTNKLQRKFTSELSDSNRTKDKLFSIIAHDLQGPINSFYSLMSLYMAKQLSKEESYYLFPKALKDIQSISEMLNNLLIWAKTQMEGAVIKPQNTDINQIVEGNILLLNPLAEKKSIQINNRVTENTFSYSDRDHIDIVLRNLISNAIKFTNHHGEINITAIEKENELQVAVRDNGVGMDLETQTKLFEKNNTKSTYGTDDEKGTGLGLSLSKEMVESNGGKIWVSSVKDKGSTIYFTMPAKAAYLEAI